jgi:membrane protease subunit (stomatin/prohibitin family)
MSTTIKCSSCGHENDEGLKFCGDCGAKLEIPKATLALDKERYTPDSEINVTVTGITKTMREEMAFVAVYVAEARHDLYGVYQYPEAGDSALVFIAPGNGSYEMRLYRKDGQYDDDTFVASVPFTVGAATGGGPVCQACGFENKPGMKFCGECGAKLEAPPSGGCPSCGFDNPPGTKFCGDCGNKL